MKRSFRIIHMNIQILYQNTEVYKYSLILFFFKEKNLFTIFTTFKNMKK